MTYYGDTWHHWQPPPPAAPPPRPPVRPTELRRLRSAYRLLRRVSALTALGYFVLFLLLSVLARDTMGTRVAGELTLGTLMGLSQLAVTFAAVRWYERSARRSVDPLARRVRQQTESAGGAAR
ncbi:DUF485 domain-containing protein [Actinacidiphila glaucinigra]|uniref:Uncharacterized membrane protein, DUF485 family n=1 Tax=Actinacidiphila glaucinigra TaxID=235986 RepID=A0A239LK47_9ACTN|nr:DUF485 domain-containing protein [Actinacidiphila glaucinigra]SNT30765.1 Uncharacterized membrane protein, DUF485 family [Actinacidiphila glaucinigra]